MENKKITGDILAVSICLTDLDKAKLKKADNGKIYLNFTIAPRKEPDKFGNDCTMFYSKTKEERDAKADTVYVSGNVKSINFDGASKPPQMTEQPVTNMDDLPF